MMVTITTVVVSLLRVGCRTTTVACPVWCAIIDLFSAAVVVVTAVSLWRNALPWSVVMSPTCVSAIPRSSGGGLCDSWCFFHHPQHVDDTNVNPAATSKSPCTIYSIIEAQGVAARNWRYLLFWMHTQADTDAPEKRLRVCAFGFFMSRWIGGLYVDFGLLYNTGELVTLLGWHDTKLMTPCC